MVIYKLKINDDDDLVKTKFHSTMHCNDKRSEKTVDLFNQHLGSFIPSGPQNSSGIGAFSAIAFTIGLFFELSICLP